MIIGAYRHFVLLAILAYWPAAIYMTQKWKGSRAMSFSEHAASEKDAYFLFAVAVTLETIFYLLFIFRWFVPVFQMPVLFKVLIVCIAFGHFVCGVIPDSKGWPRITHRIASYAVAVLFVPAILIIAHTSTISFTARMVSNALILVMAVISLINLTQKTARDNFLVYQSAFIATLPLALVAATYIR